MAKVGILTFHRASNYGAALQAYALRETISYLSFDCEVIDYGTVGQMKRLGFSFTALKPFLVSVLLFGLNIVNGDIRNLKFRKFRKEHIRISSKRYQDKTDLKKAIVNYDIFCTGSDQVWNPFLSKHDFSFLLDFVHKPMRKFSYAASFGISEIPNNLKEIYLNLISDLDQISVRETYGQKIIHELCNIDAKVAIDPTFLLSQTQWAKIAEPCRIKQHYILCYVIMADPPGLVKFCKHLRTITGFNIVRIQNPVLKLDFSFKTVKTAGPLEFLGLIKNASIVVTNSFHGTAFSIIFEKPFFTFLYNNERDIRLKEIAAKLHLNNRLISDHKKFPDLNDLKIDYTNVRKDLKIEKDESLNFLKEALSIG